MDYLASPIPDRSKPQCLICYEILSESNKFSVKRHYCQNIQRVLKKFPINSEQQKNIEKNELKLKQQRISLKCLMTENSSLTIN